MLFIRRQHTKISLDSFRIIIADVAADHVDQIMPAGEAAAIIPLSLQDSPEALHRAVINAVGHSRHTLRHTGLLQLVMKTAIRILEPTI